MALPLTVVMITLNEAHNMAEVLENLDGWAERVIVVDSYSKDAHGRHCACRGAPMSCSAVSGGSAISGTSPWRSRRKARGR